MAKNNFDACLAGVLKHEGGWSNHPGDPGGATNYGITIATYRSWLGRQASKEELRNIQMTTVAAIYRSRYWNVVKGDDLPAGVDYAVFDYGVNSGPVTAVKRLQKVIGAAQDGKVGPKTLAAIQAAGVRTVVFDLCADRMAFLRSLSTWGTFGRGWTRRVSEVETLALEMAGGRSTPQPVPEPSRQPDDPGVEPRSGKRGGAIAGAGLVAAIVGLFKFRKTYARLFKEGPARRKVVMIVLPVVVIGGTVIWLVS